MSIQKVGVVRMIFITTFVVAIAPVYSIFFGSGPCRHPVAQAVISQKNMVLVRSCQVEEYDVDGGLYYVEIEFGREMDWDVYQSWAGVVRKSGEVVQSYSNGFGGFFSSDFPFQHWVVLANDGRLPGSCRHFPSGRIQNTPNVSREIVKAQDGKLLWRINYNRYHYTGTDKSYGEWGCMWSGHIEANIDGSNPRVTILSVSFPQTSSCDEFAYDSSLVGRVKSDYIRSRLKCCENYRMAKALGTYDYLKSHVCYDTAFEQCDSLEDYDERAYCLRDVAIATKDPKICDAIPKNGGEFPFRDKRDNCYSVTARELKRPDLCLKVDDPIDQNRCLQGKN